MDKNTENNVACLVGEVVGEFAFSHEVYGEGFYMVSLSVDRLSQTKDVLPVLVSERLVDVAKNIVGTKVFVNGHYRSYNQKTETGSHLILTVFANEFRTDFDESEVRKTNIVYLDGYVCKPPVYRKTPLGREIGDVLLAVNRAYGKTDYIPCICWGRNARFLEKVQVGSRLAIEGRIQSREYNKKLGDGTEEKRTAYEVSVAKISEAID